MKKAMLLGSSFSALPILLNLKSRGYHVTVVGKYETDPCHEYSDSSLFIDYSDPDFSSSSLDFAIYDAVVPSCNDYAYLAGGQIAERFGQPGYDPIPTIHLLHEKHHFRKFCAENGIRAPKVFGHARNAEAFDGERLEFPAIVKPVDSFSGRGASIVHNHKEALEALEIALSQSRAEFAIVEQFVAGNLHSHSAFICRGQIVWEDFVDEYCGVYAYQVDRSQYPSRVAQSVRDGVRSEIERIVEILGLTDGLLHTQFIASGRDFWLIECMRRCPGDLFPEHFSGEAGLSYWQRYLQPFLGLPVDGRQGNEAIPAVERRVLSSSCPVAFYGVALTGRHQNVVIIPVKESGHLMRPAPYDKAAIVFIRAAPTETSEEVTSIEVAAHELTKLSES